MTRGETQKLLAIIHATYPNMKVTDPTVMVNAWHLFLEEYDYSVIQQALVTFARSGQGKGFAPSVDQLISMAQLPQQLATMGEAEAWDLVNKALRCSGYLDRAQKEFDKLPPAVQRSVGSANQLRTWALDDSFNESVVASNFKRAYRSVIEREKQIQSLPTEVRERLGQVQALALEDKR